MNLRKLSLFLGLALLTASARAQLGIYATATATRVSNISYTTGDSSSSDAKIYPVGGSFGAYYDFRNLGPLRLGVDARGMVTHASHGAFTEANGFGAHMASALGGIRLSFHTPIAILHPYVEGAAGLGRTNYGTSYDQYNNVEYHGFVGLDVRASSVLDVRVFELGYGGLSGGSPTSRNYPMESVSMGLVLRFP